MTRSMIRAYHSKLKFKRMPVLFFDDVRLVFHWKVSFDFERDTLSILEDKSAFVRIRICKASSKIDGILKWSRVPLKYKSLHLSVVVDAYLVHTTVFFGREAKHFNLVGEHLHASR